MHSPRYFDARDIRSYQNKDVMANSGKDPYLVGEAYCTIQIQLSELELLACMTCMVDCTEWARNAMHERARIAADEVIQKYATVALQNGWTIPNTKLDIVKAAYEKGVVRGVSST